MRLGEALGGSVVALRLAGWDEGSAFCRFKGTSGDESRAA